MIHKISRRLLTFLLIGCQTAFAQVPDSPFQKIDEFVKSVGALDSLNMGAISHILTRPYSDNRDKVRALFTWIALHIELDCKAARSNEQEKTLSDVVLKKRKATAGGYAALFQDMCSVAKIRCLTVEGYAKTQPEQIGEKPDAFNHHWAVVQLGQSPDSWYYVDPTWGSGYADEKMTRFTRQFRDMYFFSNKTLFNLQHFPDNRAWQLGSGPRSLRDFIDLPVIGEAAYRFNASGFLPATGLVKMKANRKETFSLQVATTSNLSKLTIETGADKGKKRKEIPFVQDGGRISFTLQFPEEDSFPLTVYFDDKPMVAYKLEVTE